MDKVAQPQLPLLAVEVFVGNLEQDVVALVHSVHHPADKSLLRLQRPEVAERAETALAIGAGAGVRGVGVHAVDVVVAMEGMQLPQVRMLEHPGVKENELKMDAPHAAPPDTACAGGRKTPD